MASNVTEIIYTRNPERSSQPSDALKYVPDEIAFDPYKLCLYHKAIRKGKVKEKILRINIIGNYGQGKSSLAKSLIGQPSEDIASTNGIDIIRYKCHPTKEGIVTATQHDEADDGDLIARIATVARNVTIKDKEDDYDDDDVDDVESDHFAESEILEENVNIENPSLDEQSSESSLDEAIEPFETTFENTAVEDGHPTEIIPQPINNFQPTFDENEDITAVESNEESASSKFPLSTDDYKKFDEAFEKENDDLGHQLEIWDFGGQFIFYSTHRLFHSKNALYLLVFDLTKSLDETVRDEEFPNETGDRNMKYFARFWLESIDAYTGPDTKVILVGTHKDILPDPGQTKANYFENVRSLFEPADGDANSQLFMHIHQEDFAVDNKNSPNSGIKELLNFIINYHHELVNVVEIPARWIELEKAIKRHREKKIITLQDVIDIDKNNKYPLGDINQLKLFLSYQHNKGTFCFYDDGQNTDAVVIVPQLLVDAIKCVITSEHFVKNQDERTEWEKLKREGRLSEKLIEKKWSSDAIFRHHKDVIIRFLVKQYILSPVNRSNKPEVEYLVPCMLRSGVDTATKALKQFVDRKRQTQIRLLLKFSRPAVVQMVFHRLVAAVLGIWPLLNLRREKLLYENFGVFEVLETNGNTTTNHAAVIQVAQDCGAIELRVVHLRNGELNSNVVGQVRRYIESFVEREFGSLHRDDTKPFTRAYRCNNADHTVDEKNTKDASCTEDAGSVMTNSLEDLDDIRCPDNETHPDEFYVKAKKEWFSEDLDVKDFPPVSLTDIHISLCSQAIGENWEQLAPHLRVNEITIDHMMDDNRTTCMRIYKMLLQWKRTCSESVTLEALVAALKKCPAVRVCWDVFKNIRDEFERTCSKETGFNRQLSDERVLFDTKLRLQCSIANPNSPVSWQKNGKDIISDDHFHISAQDGQHILSIEHVVEDDSARYMCVCEGDVTECVVKVVKESSNGLEIIQQLEDTDAQNTVVENSVIINTAIFICELNKCTSDVRWIFSGKSIEQSDKSIEQSDKFDLIVEGFVHKLRIKNVTEEDEGLYSIVAEDKKSQARLYVEDTEEEKSLLQDYRQLRMVEYMEEERSYHLEDQQVGMVEESSSELVHRAVTLQKEDGRFWFTIHGSKPVFVLAVTPGKVADKAGVRPGDRIIEVNGSLITYKSHKDAADIIKKESNVTLTLLSRSYVSDIGNAGHQLGERDASHSVHAVASHMENSSIKQTEKSKKPSFMNIIHKNTTRVEIPHVHQFVEKCIRFIEEEGLEIRGLYRVSGLKQKISLLMKRYNEDRDMDIKDLEISIHAVTSALKESLRNSDPLIPYAVLQDLYTVLDLDRADQVIAAKETLSKIDTQDYETLKLILKHLHRVSEHSDMNQMTVKNLSVCLWPVLLKTSEKLSIQISGIPKQELLLTLLIENSSSLF